MNVRHWIQLDRVCQDPPIFRVQCRDLDGYYAAHLGKVVYSESGRAMCVHVWETNEKRSVQEVWYTTHDRDAYWLSNVVTGKTYDQIMSVITNDLMMRTE